MRGLRVATLLVLLVGLIAGCASSDSTNRSGRIDVVAGENFWGNIVAQLGGSHVSVTSIITDPNADPHSYESDAKDAAALARARFVVVNGLGYDDFMSKLLSVSGTSKRVVLTVAKVLDISGSNPNPHIWYDTQRLPQVVAALAAELSQLDPTNQAEFEANAAAFDSSLTPIKSKYGGTPIAYTERVPGYLVEAAGLTLGIPATFAQAIEDGNDPNAADTHAFDTALTSHRVKVLLYNAQVTDAQTDKIKQLAKSSGVPIVGVTETLPPSDKSFQDWQLRQADELLAALGG
jgi:zinc/manganese transport system substrate-binding protein